MENFVISALETDPKYTFLGALGLLFLCLWYITRLLNKQDIPKPQRKITRKRRGVFRGRRICQREEEEGRRLLSILQSLPGQPYDTTRVRQLLCPDPLCKVCNTVTAKVSRLLSQASMAAAAPSVSHLASTASVAKSSFSLTSACSKISPGHSVPATPPEPCPPSFSTVSLNQDTPLKDLLSPSPLGDSLPPEPNSPLDSQFPVEPFSPETLALPPPPLHHMQQTGPVLQRSDTLSLMDGPAEFSTNVTTTKVNDSANISMSEFSCQQPHAENLPTSELAHDINQELVDLHFPQASFLGDITVYVVVSRMLTFLSPDVLTLLERLIKNRADFLMSKDKEKKTKSFQNQFKLEYQLNPAGKILQSVTDQQDSAVSLPFGSSTGKPADLNMSQQPPCLKTIEDQFQKNCMQLFWGLPCLHSESLRPTVCASGDCPSYFTCFNSTFKASIAHEAKGILHFTASSSPEIQSQALPEPLPQFPFPHVPINQFQAQLQSPLPVLPPSSLSQPRSCGVCFHSPQSEAQSLTVSEIHHLEYHVLQKQQEIMWGLPTVVQRSQERFCSPAPKLALASRSTKAYVPISILPGDFPLDSALRGKLEYHLQKRLIQHRWGLPRRIFESLSKMRPYTEIPQTSESESSHGLSWISFYKRESCKDLNNYELRSLRNFYEKLCNGSETLPLENRVEKELGHSLEIGPNNHLLSHLQGAPDNSLGHDTKTEVECHAGDISGFSGTFGVSPCQIKSKDALEVHLSKKFGEINEGQVPDIVQSSWHSTKMTLPVPKKSSSKINQSDLTQLMSQGKNKDSSLNTPQGVSLPDSSKHEILEDLIKILAITLNTETSSVRTSVSHDPEQSAFKDQLIKELKLKLESRKQSQAQGFPGDVPLASDTSTLKTLLTCDQCVSSGDKAASQVLHVQLNNKGISMQPQQEPWVPTNVSRKCQDKNFPPAVKKPCLPAPKRGELGGGDAGLGTSQTRRKSCQPEDRASKMTLGRSSSTLSLKRQPPPENSFKNKMKQFFQFLCPGAKEKSHGSFLGKGSSSSTSMQGRDPGKGRAAFSMNTKNQNLLTNVDKVNKVIEEKLGQKHTMSMACPQVPRTSSRKSEKTEHKAEPKVQAETIQGRPFSCKPRHDKMTSVKSSKEAAFAGQIYPVSNPCVKYRAVPP